MEVILHIGTEKTGTTTIQECLFQNREFLRKKGIGLLKSLGDRNHRNLVTFSMDIDNTDDHFRWLGIKSKSERRQWKKRVEYNFKTEISTIPSNIKTVIISSEHFHSRLRDISEIYKLRDFLKQFFDKISVLVYLRRQDELAVSLYSTKCRVGNSSMNLLPMEIHESNHYYNYSNLLDMWAEAFQPEFIIPVIFEKQKLIKEDLINDFFIRTKLLNIQDINNLEVPMLMNESLSWQNQLVLLYFNKYFGFNSNNDKNKLNQLIRNKISDSLNMKFPGKSLLPLKSEAIRFYEIFKKSNADFGRKWFQTDKPFSEDFSKYPDTNKDYKLSPEVLDTVFKTLDEFINKK